MFFTGLPICVGNYTNNFHNVSCWMGQHPPCDAPMESPDSALFEGIGSSVPRLYHRKELTYVHAKWVVVLIFQWFLSSSFYGSRSRSLLLSQSPSREIAWVNRQSSSCSIMGILTPLVLWVCVCVHGSFISSCLPIQQERARETREKVNLEWDGTWIQ